MTRQSSSITAASTVRNHFTTRTNGLFSANPRFEVGGHVERVVENALVEDSPCAVERSASINRLAVNKELVKAKAGDVHERLGRDTGDGKLGERV